MFRHPKSYHQGGIYKIIQVQQIVRDVRVYRLNKLFLIKITKNVEIINQLSISFYKSKYRVAQKNVYTLYSFFMSNVYTFFGPLCNILSSIFDTYLCQLLSSSFKGYIPVMSGWR